MPKTHTQTPPLTLQLTLDERLIILWRAWIVLCAIAVGISACQLIETMNHGWWLKFLGGTASAALVAGFFLIRPPPDSFTENLQLLLTDDSFVLMQADQQPVRGEWHLHWQFPGLVGLKLAGGAHHRVLWLTPRRTGRDGWHRFMQLLTLSGRATPV